MRTRSAPSDTSVSSSTSGTSAPSVSPVPPSVSTRRPRPPRGSGVAPHALPVDRGDRRRGIQLVLGILLFLAAQTLSMVVAGLAAAATGTSPSEGPAGWALLLGALAGAALALGGYRLIVGRVGGRPGLTLSGRGKVAELVQGLALGVVLICLSVGLIALLGGYTVTGVATSPRLLVPLAVGIGAGVIEEIFFRGILLRLLDAWLGSWAALALSSLLFGLLHLMNPGANLVTALGLVIEAGVLLGAAYLLTRRLWLAIGLHIAWNTVQAGVFSSAVSGTGRQSGLLIAETSGPTWLTGGDMGVEGSFISVLLGLGTGLVMLVLAARRGRLLPSVRAERAIDPSPATLLEAARS